MKLLRHENKNYFLQNKIKSGNVVVCLTDLKAVWHKILLKNEFIELFKADNCIVEISDELFLENIPKLFDNEETKVQLNFSELEVNVIFTMHLCGSVINLNIKLTEHTNEFVFTELTLPLLMIIDELQYRQEKLIALVKAKDVELTEYKLERGTITRRNAVTEKFNLLTFENECSSDLSERAKQVLKDPGSALCSSLNKIYSEITNLIPFTVPKTESEVGDHNFDSHKEENNALPKEIKDSEADLKTVKIATKRSIPPDSLKRIKKPKKAYKL